MPRSKNVLNFTIQLNGRAIHNNMFTFPVDEDPERIGKVIRAELSTIESVLSDQFGVVRNVKPKKPKQDE